MLSYMVPSIEEKPPPVPANKRFQLDLDNPRLTFGHAVVNGTDTDTDMLVTTPSVRTVDIKVNGAEGTVKGGSTSVVKSSTISTESSASSLSSGVGAPEGVAATHVDKPRLKLLSNGATKQQTLKRVSFGSSKGSMVETLIYESPVQEEPEVVTPEPSDSAMLEIKHPSKVRVTFFEQDKPLVVSSPEPDLTDELDAPFVLSMTSPSPIADNAATYNRQASTDSGWDNPFRPDGDLSREADEIVELIKGGKPITPTPGGTALTLDPGTQCAVTPARAPAANGSTPGTPAPAKPASPPGPGAVELQRATVTPSEACQPEHVVLKKKPKCKCCVIQ